MNKSTKAALLSALVFPGAGHLFLKKYLAGAGLAIAALGSLSLILADLIERALQVAAQIRTGEVPLEVAAIIELLTRQPTGGAAQLLNYAWMVLIFSWLLGVVDAYRVGLGQEH